MERGLHTSLVIEDDLRFEVFFKRRLVNLMSEVEEEGLDWDLMYGLCTRKSVIPAVARDPTDLSRPRVFL